ncbi:AsnC family transcriptional regulator [Amycolatopsis antarctica]|uniref:AsnC family transcriptional regulator n=1 Tax=Amycolatopsis antarctica TaxID=1854586 RepID=A0A263CYS2_9PSEU|nr:Lrp/AsnC family transcriptional regulator [Amycolatopsis antarctica]OZM71312.1 AsnC family transcriptional regulator [Amycolatopsis antarctica]
MDSIDKGIVSCLVANARASYADIGKSVNLSTPAVKRRVDRLLRTGVLRGFTAVVDPEALGWATEALVDIFCRNNVAPERIREHLEPFAEIAAAYTVTGAANVVVHLRARDIGKLETVLERLRGLDMVERTTSTVILSTLLDRRAGVGPR